MPPRDTELDHVHADGLGFDIMKGSDGGTPAAVDEHLNHAAVHKGVQPQDIFFVLQQFEIVAVSIGVQRGVFHVQPDAATRLKIVGSPQFHADGLRASRLDFGDGLERVALDTERVVAVKYPLGLAPMRPPQLLQFDGGFLAEQAVGTERQNTGQGQMGGPIVPRRAASQVHPPQEPAFVGGFQGLCGVEIVGAAHVDAVPRGWLKLATSLIGTDGVNHIAARRAVSRQIVKQRGDEQQSPAVAQRQEIGAFPRDTVFSHPGSQRRSVGPVGQVL